MSFKSIEAITSSSPYLLILYKSVNHQVFQGENKWTQYNKNFKIELKLNQCKLIEIKSRFATIYALWLTIIRVVISPIINLFLHLRKLNIWLKENQGKFLIGSKSMQYFINAIDHLSTLFCLWFHVQCRSSFSVLNFVSCPI